MTLLSIHPMYIYIVLILYRFNRNWTFTCFCSNHEIAISLLLLYSRWKNELKVAKENKLGIVVNRGVAFLTSNNRVRRRSIRIRLSDRLCSRFEVTSLSYRVYTTVSFLVSTWSFTLELYHLSAIYLQNSEWSLASNKMI